MTTSELINPIYHIAVKPLADDYRNHLSFRSIAKKWDTSTKTARELVVGEGISVRANDGLVYEERRSDVIDKAVADYVAGAGVRVIQSRYHINPRVFYRYLEKRGVPVRSAQTSRFPHLSEENRKRIASDFQSGMFMTDIATKYGLSKSSVKTLLRHSGLRRRSRTEITQKTEYGGMGTKNIPGYIISQWKGSAKTRGHDWTLTPEYLQELYDQQGGKCYYTGLTLEIPAKRNEGRKRSPYRISLDRKDSNGGYTQGNVVLASAFANYAKNDWEIGEFESLLDQTSKYRMGL